ncbi:MAG: CYTH domain-containing protein [Lachnospiraceae bacterium]|nr:CYTH domain-containing protein [Lachnospiraceae bacterium]
MEIERKFLLKRLPQQMSHYESANLKQAYLCTDPVIRIRKKNNHYILTYKSAGLMEREEVEVPLNQTSFEHLLKKCDGNIIAKTRYYLPLESGLTVEIDEFHDGFDGLIIAEVEFPDRETAEHFVPPIWLNHEVTNDPKFQNSNLSMMSENERITLLKKLYRAH